jgi:uncharacterized membrane protein YraQ (UPF0718 family)/copper chaperone CopZ
MNAFQEILYFYHAVAVYLVLGLAMAGIMYVVFPESLIRRQLGGRSLLSIFKATAIGVPLPLCSCGVIPVAASLNRSGASRGAVSAFLVSTPQVGPDSYLITYSLFGWVFAVFRIAAALVTAFFVGILFLLRERRLPAGAPASEGPFVSPESLKARLKNLPSHAEFNILGPIANSLVLGILLAGVITALVPDWIFNRYLGSHWSSMLFMLLLGIPLYVCASASTPVAASLMFKGVSPGSALVFLLVGPATNTVTLAAVTKMMGKRMALLYAAGVAAGSIAMGIILDLFAGGLGVQAAVHAHHHGAMLPAPLMWAGSITLAAMLAVYYIRTKVLDRFHRNKGAAVMNEKISLNVEGMTCLHCASTVKKAVAQISGTSGIVVDLDRKRVEFVVDDAAKVEQVRESIRSAGYEA